MLSQKAGFSLIEVLVVVTILGILSTIGVTSFMGIQAKARDSERKSDLRAFTSALEIYYQKNDQYIDGTPAGNGDCTLTGPDTTTFYSQITSFMANQIVPKDPLTQDPYCYVSEGNGQSFRLFAKLENSSDKDINTNCTNYNYTLFSQDLTASCAPGDTPAPTPLPPTPSPTPPPPITFIARNQAAGQASPVSWTQSCSGNNRMLIVTSAEWRVNSNSQIPIGGITYNGPALTKLGQEFNTSTGALVTMWYLINPSSGGSSITATFTNTDISFGSSCWSNVLQQAPSGFNTDIGSSTTPDVTVSGTNTTDVVVDGVAVLGSNTLTPLVNQVIAGQTGLANTAIGNSHVGHSWKAGANISTGMVWTNSGSNLRWAIVGAALKQAP